MNQRTKTIFRASGFVAGLVGLSLAAGLGQPAFAQKPAERKATPAKPAPQAQAPAPNPAQRAVAGQSQQTPELMYSPWIKICNKAPNDATKQICVTAKDGRLENGMPVAAAALIEPQGEAKKIIRITVPLGMQLQHGTRLIIDQDTPQTAPYFMCFPNGCMADYEANADTVAKLKKGKTLTLQAINMQGQAISLPLPLTDFAKAYDGPPTDPKVFAEQQQKLQDELQKKAEEARKKLESQQPAASAPPKQ